MDIHFLLNTSLTGVSFAITIGMLVLILNRRQVPGALSFGAVIVCEILWLVGYILEVFAPTLTDKLLLDNLQYIPFLGLVPALLWFIQDFTNTHRRSSFGHALLTLAFSGLLFVLAVTNGFRGNQRPDARIVAEGSTSLLEYSFNLWDYAAVVYVTFAVLAVIIALLLHAQRQPAFLRPQVYTIAVGFLLPTLAYFLVFTGLRIGFQRDPSPYALTLSNLLIAWGLFRHRLFDLRPIALEAVFDRLADILVTVDHRGRLVDLNPAARSLPWLSTAVPGSPAVPLFKSFLAFPDRLDQAMPMEFECRMTVETVERFYDLSLIPLHDRRGTFAGHLLVLHDISRRKRMEMELRTIQSGLENRVAEHTAELSRTIDLLTVSEESLSKSVDRLNCLHAIDRAILSRADIELVLKFIAQQSQREFNADTVVALLFDLKNGKVELRVEQGEMPGAWFPASDVLAEEVQRKKQTVTLMVSPDLSQGDGRIGYCAAVPIHVNSEVRGALIAYSRARSDASEQDLNFLEVLAGQAAIAVSQTDLFKRLEETNRELRESYSATIISWAKALEIRDKETSGHTDRVTGMALDLARSLDFPQEQIDNFIYGVILHDIGKMLVPDAILHKPGPLNDEEWVTMREHVNYGVDIISTNPSLSRALDVPACHHEWWDGSGYPRGIRGEDIPLGARIFAVIDVWDALTNKRVYRDAWDPQHVLEYIRERAGRQFDPVVVTAFVAMLQVRRSAAAN